MIFSVLQITTNYTTYTAERNNKIDRLGMFCDTFKCVLNELYSMIYSGSKNYSVVFLVAFSASDVTKIFFVKVNRKKIFRGKFPSSVLISNIFTDMLLCRIAFNFVST